MSGSFCTPCCSGQINFRLLLRIIRKRYLFFRTLKEYVNPPFPAVAASNHNKHAGGAPAAAESESIDYLIMGHVMATVPIRDRSSKWYLPAKFYPLNIFPRYVQKS